MRYQFAQVNRAVEERLRRMFAQCSGKEICVSGAVRLMMCGSQLPVAVFLSEEELSLLEDNGYDRHHDPYLLHDSVVLVMELPSEGQMRQRGIYEQGNLF